ncbi:long-chain fatty acid--CoA ligase [Couchioplanes caeruleus]|uniref:long-chain fatty acid--CoA ligase n=1 Tax=Couchioplanes caeruleus TaxID=56438 RepID=UPI0020BE5402|nr:long-chain fatty acid--CoA ligase [Couchioplanes caeruleus]UQU67783.1 long-chain fatty acid--CoA ligase [Couchioplanes caeruleus]
MRGLMQQSPLTVPVLMRRVERLFGHKRVITATAAGEVVATWADVVARARRLAAVFDALHVPHQGRVGTFGWNSQRHVELYLAAPGSGRVLHTLNHRLFAEEIVHIVNDAADDVLFVDRSLMPRVWPLVDRLPTVRRVVVLDDGGRADLPADPRLADYEELLSGVRETALPAAVEEDDAASLCYTSGTTGLPKGVLYSHRSIVLHALMLLGVDTFAISERDVVMPIVPMFHVNAWGLPYAAMLAGSDLVLPGPAMTPPELIGQMARHQVTFSAAVATIWRGLQPLLGTADLSSLRMVVSGGGALPGTLSKAWQDGAGIPLTNAWGMTETSPVVTCARLATHHDGLDADARREVLRKPGPPLPLTEIRIVDEAGALVERAGAAGELQASGPTVASAYFGAEPSPNSFTIDGWLRTGDVGAVNPYGYLEIIDRTKDMVKSGGEWISSVQLENEIMAYPAVHEAAVIAVGDERWGERPLACVVLVPGRSLDVQDLRDHLAASVASWWIPERIIVVDEIPKTATGKFSKVSLRALVQAREAG